MSDIEHLFVIFVREDCFYPIQLLEPAECGRSIAQQAADHAEVNPGTVRVEDMRGNVLWARH